MAAVILAFFLLLELLGVAFPVADSTICPLHINHAVILKGTMNYENIMKSVKIQ